MDQKPRCQSCGMPVGPGFYGTNSDGSENLDYCKFCYQKGQFTHPDLTLEEMIDMSVLNMTKKLQIPEEKARELAWTLIPKLKRWSKFA